MAVSDSIKTRIVENIVSTVDAISAGDTYARTVLKAERAVLSPTTIQRDMVYVTSQRTQMRKLVSSKKEVDLYVDLECVVSDRDDLAQAIDDIATDVETALELDRTRGNLAIDTEVTSTEDYVVEELEPHAVCVVHVRVQFRHVRGDPRSQ